MAIVVGVSIKVTVLSYADRLILGSLCRISIQRALFNCRGLLSMDKLWKSFEREVGKTLFNGSRRNMGSGAVNRKDDGEQRTGDIIHPNYQVECKCYKKIPVFNLWDINKRNNNITDERAVVLFENMGVVLIHQNLFTLLLDAYEQFPINDAGGHTFPLFPSVTMCRYTPKKLGVMTWWVKVAEEAVCASKIPFLVMRQVGNRKQTLVMMDIATYKNMVSSALKASRKGEKEDGERSDIK